MVSGPVPMHDDFAGRTAGMETAEEGTAEQEIAPIKVNSLWTRPEGAEGGPIREEDPGWLNS